MQSRANNRLQPCCSCPKPSTISSSILDQAGISFPGSVAEDKIIHPIINMPSISMSAWQNLWLYSCFLPGWWSDPFLIFAAYAALQYQVFTNIFSPKRPSLPSMWKQMSSYHWTMQSVAGSIYTWSSKHGQGYYISFMAEQRWQSVRIQDEAHCWSWWCLPVSFNLVMMTDPPPPQWLQPMTCQNHQSPPHQETKNLGKIFLGCFAASISGGQRFCQLCRGKLRGDWPHATLSQERLNAFAPPCSLSFGREVYTPSLPGTFLNLVVQWCLVNYHLICDMPMCWNSIMVMRQWLHLQQWAVNEYLCAYGTRMG